MTRVEWITDPSLYNIAVFYSKSLATRLEESRVDPSLRQLDSMRVYWTTLSQGDASSQSSCIYLWLHLARPCVHLRWLLMTCAHFGRDPICTQVDSSFSPFDHPTQVSASWVTPINLLHCTSQWNRGYICLEIGFLQLLCTCEETCESVWPPNASLYASSTCGYLWLLVSLFDQGFSHQFARLFPSSLLTFFQKKT